MTSIMPCVAKKQEIDRSQLSVNETRSVDHVLTTRELASMIKEAGIDFKSLPDEEHDDPLGIYTGAAAIFGASGGVMEAALRTVYEVITGEELGSLDFTGVRGLEGIKEASVEILGKTYNVAVTSGLGNAKTLIDSVLSGAKSYHFIEIMACPGGCIGGGGQPIMNDKSDRLQRLEERAKSLYALDKDLPFRKSHKNPAIVALYKEYLGEPLSHRAHELLHTTYQPRISCVPLLASM